MDQKSILISGASRGIGRYLSEYYSLQNYVVYGCSRSNSNFTHDNYKHFIVDVANEEDVLKMFQFFKSNKLKLDILINNAAVNPSIISAALLRLETIETAFKINVFGTMLLSKSAVKLMLKSKFGRIINIGSMATHHEVPGEALYTATKAAINAYSRVLAKEVAKANITVNVISPSVISTELSAKINPEALQEVLNRNAINKYGELADVSNVIDFLIRNQSESVTGQIIYLGGV